MQPGEIMTMLAEGRRNAVANSTAVAKIVLKSPQLMATLVDALTSPNKTIGSHAAHALLTVFKENPKLLQPFVGQLLKAFARGQWETMEQIAKILPGLTLSKPQQKTFLQRLEAVFYEGNSSIARTSAMQALSDLSKQHVAYRQASVKALKFALEQGSKAMQARARKLVEQPRDKR